MATIDHQKITELLSRGVEEIIDKEHLKKELESGKILRVKLGIDPTSPNIHLGRAIPLLKLRDFQKLGHKIVLIIGDGTGVIGDTSDKESERPMLDRKTITANMKTYTKQAGKILDIKKCEIHYNSKWLSKLGYDEIGEQADQFSLHEMMMRENIKNRLDEGKRVSLRELLYPLMQGYDSVAVKANVELGGKDQYFNLLAGRELQRHYGQEPQDIMTNPLIEGLDGRKMSSSWGNTVNILDSTNEMFGKIMSLRDEFIEKYFVLVTRVPFQVIEKVMSTMNPRDQKAALAKEIVMMCHGEKEAESAEEEFNKTFRDRKPDFINFETNKSEELYPKLIDDALVTVTGAISSVSAAKRLIAAGAVEINGKVDKEWNKQIKITEEGKKIKIGKKTFINVKFKK